MPTPLSEIDAELRHTGPLNDIGVCLAAGAFLILRLLVSFVDCGRVMRDIVLGVLCGATVGLFVAMARDFFLTGAVLASVDRAKWVVSLM